MPTLYINKPVVSQFWEFWDKFYVLLLLFYNKVANRSLSNP
jgi:hypothetical protein